MPRTSAEFFFVVASTTSWRDNALCFFFLYANLIIRESSTGSVFVLRHFGFDDAIVSQ